MNGKRPEYFHGVSNGTTTAQTSWELNIGAPTSAAAFALELDALEAHCALCARSDAEDVRRYGVEELRLLKRARAAMARAAAAAVEAGYHLGRHVEEWRAKDHTEAQFLERIKQRAARQLAGARTIDRVHPGDKVLSLVREWRRVRPAETREAAYVAIATILDKDDPDKPALVKKQVLAAEKRERMRAARGQAGQ